MFSEDQANEMRASEVFCAEIQCTKHSQMCHESVPEAFASLQQMREFIQKSCSEVLQVLLLSTPDERH